MKKLIVGLAVLVVVVIIAVVIGLYAGINRLVKAGVETVGPRVTKTSVTLNEARLSLFSGAGSLHGLMIGNPEGFKTERAFNLGEIRLKVDPASLRTDRIVIRELIIDGPEVTYEQGLKGSNISTLLANVKAFAGGGGTEAPGPQSPANEKEGSGKKLEVDHFVFQNAKVRLGSKLTGSKTVSLPLGKIELRDLGKQGDDTLGATLTKIALALNKAILETVADSDQLLDQGRKTLETGKAMGEELKGTAEKTARGLKGLLGGDKN